MHQVTRARLVVTIAAVCAAGITGCSGPAQEDAPPQQSQTTGGAQSEGDSGDVETAKSALEKLAGKSSLPTSKQLFDALQDAGFKDDQLEASIDKSPLGHDVPSKMFGIRVSDGCVIGEVREGKVSAELAQPIESLDSCLIGEVDLPKGVERKSGEPKSDDEKDSAATSGADADSSENSEGSGVAGE
ncbi:hypothetical protein LWF01_09895 [Saxibacter everestensis]|uniref:DUF6993 domain-containing protein n=1 Tax=Saxibacter everestensis TaxID=2909229 RepID=A0ABY8QNC3_9MICO|nr:hypothetical protein LWF01_09895 [Brevibacteriaceae bacterium ZFBP1038]